MGKYMALGPREGHRGRLLDIPSYHRGDASRGYGRVVHPGDIPRLMFGSLHPQMQQRARPHLWRIHRVITGCERVQRRTTWPNGYSSHPAQC